MRAETLTGGFEAPAHQAAHAFRAIMDALARPGRTLDATGAAPPAPLSTAAGAVLLTRCDSDTPVHLAGAFDTPEVRTWLAFHTGAPIATPAGCMFALGAWEGLQPLSAYPIGTSEYPDRSATLIVECDALSGEGAVLRGPGIQGAAALSLPEVAAFQANAALFPLGLDFIFTSGTHLAALPRTTQVTAQNTGGAV